ncbi:MFS transporter [Anaeroselena agilis]|uniref:MFS transporter n=1 Tax=Anaeroselena agilis TaxID=3063788 RepID=A0ABU3P455_9FIRM|nr:MFS transporter [Selenomonadales bacterium 4137-cl]
MQTIGKKNIANFIIAYILSAFGYEFIFFLMTIYVYNLTQSALNVGVFAALTFTPRLFASVYGVVVDRYSRAAVFAAAAGATAVLVAAMSLSSSLIWIYALWLLISLLLTVITTVRTALMTEIMTQDGFLLGNSAVLTSLNCAKMLAPLLAGLATAAFSTAALFVATAAAYLVVAALSRIISLPRHAAAATPRQLLPEVAAGLRYILASPKLRFLIAVAFMWTLSLRLQLPLFVVYVKSFLGGGDQEYGYFMTAVGIGSILGSLAGPWLMKRGSHLALAMAGLTIHYSSFILLAFVQSFYLAAAAVFGGYVFFYAALVGLHSLRDLATAADLRGRVYGSVTAILTPAAIVSMLAGGYLAGRFGADKVLAVAGLTALATLYFLYWFAYRRRAGAAEDRLVPRGQAS